MGWSVDRHSEPQRKLDLLERRLGRLRGAVKHGESSAHIARAAEKVRLAVLAVIKAKRALITEYPERDPTGRQSRNLRDVELRWLTLSTAAIVEEYGKDATPDRTPSWFAIAGLHRASVTSGDTDDATGIIGKPG